MMRSIENMTVPKNPPKGLTSAEFEWYFIQKSMMHELNPGTCLAELWILYEAIDTQTAKGKVLCQCIKRDYADSRRLVSELLGPPILNNFERKSQHMDMEAPISETGDAIQFTRLK